jgi:DNA-binding transcriptional MerR regulator
MLKIGEFARLSQVSMKTLRHYDTLGLLRPSQIDVENGYRLYELEQLADMIRIQALKDCGFALEEIAHLLQTHDVKAIEGLLNQRIVDQQQVIADEQARNQRLIARLKLLSSTEYVPHYDVALKRTEPLTLVGLRECIASREDIGPLAQTALQRFEQQALVPIGPLIHIYFDVETESIDLFIGAPVMALPSAIHDLSCERFSGGEQVACVLHRGDYTTISNAYVALHLWLSTSGYRLSGSCREIYHRSTPHTTDTASYLTEIQLPIQAVDE